MEELLDELKNVCKYFSLLAEAGVADVVESYAWVEGRRLAEIIKKYDPKYRYPPHVTDDEYDEMFPV